MYDLNSNALFFYEDVPQKAAPSTPIRPHQPDGQWSVQENIGHLLDLEPLWFGRGHDIVSGEKTMCPADLSNRKTPEAGHNSVSIEKILAEFAAQRQLFVALCEAHSDVLTTASALHPRLEKPMRIIDLMYFVAEHDDHHIATIRHYMVY